MAQRPIAEAFAKSVDGVALSGHCRRAVIRRIMRARGIRADRFGSGVNHKVCVCMVEVREKVCLSCARLQQSNTIYVAHMEDTHNSDGRMWMQNRIIRLKVGKRGAQRIGPRCAVGQLIGIPLAIELYPACASIIRSG